MLQNKKIIILEVAFIVFASLIFSSGIGSLFSGNLNLLDEGQFASWAYQMTQGKLMYKDLFIMYGPLFIYPLFILFKFFGASFFLVRLYSYLGALLGLITIYFLCIKLKFKSITRFIIYLLLVLLPGLQIRQAAALVIIYLLLQTNDKKGNNWSFILGLTTTVGFLISPEIGIYSTVVVVDNLLIEKSRKESVKTRLVSYLVGIMSVLILFVIWAISEGWLTYYLKDTLYVLYSFSGIESPLGKNFPNLLTIFSPNLTLFSLIKYLLSPEAIFYWTILFFIASFVYFLVQISLKKFSKNDQAIFPFLILSVFLYVSVIGRAAISHYYFILPFLFLLGAFFVEKLVYSKRMSYIILALCMLAIPIRLVTINRINLFRNLKNLSHYSQYVSISRNDPLRVDTLQKKYIEDVQRLVSKESQKVDYIFILQDEPGLYVLSQRLNATVYDLPYIANTKEKRMEIVHDLRARKPKVIIWNPSAWAVDEISNKIRLPEVVAYINLNYIYKNTSSGIIYWTLKRS